MARDQAQVRPGERFARGHTQGHAVEQGRGRPGPVHGVAEPRAGSGLSGGRDAGFPRERRAVPAGRDRRPPWRLPRAPPHEGPLVAKPRGSRRKARRGPRGLQLRRGHGAPDREVRREVRQREGRPLPRPVPQRFHRVEGVRGRLRRGRQPPHGPVPQPDEGGRRGRVRAEHGKTRHHQAGLDPATPRGRVEDVHVRGERRAVVHVRDRPERRGQRRHPAEGQRSQRDRQPDAGRHRGTQG
mmetsp:Transcript_37150/g.84892  ORF Transcript_37150/g.84892 Transcript_37150/m.84892 type:complete len:241 (-) Transcript_37150:227-949(-)